MILYRQGRTLLMDAAQLGQPGIVKLLVSLGADTILKSKRVSQPIAQPL